MKKYNENKNINELISYNNLIINYAILETTIKCAKEDILNLDEIIILSKFVWAWEKIYNKVKENPNFQKLKYRDGYIIDYMINEIPGCKYKVVVKTFDKITKEFKTEGDDIEKFEINGIALLFPYLRSIISTYTANSNMPTLILPPINVGDYYKEHKKMRN